MLCKQGDIPSIKFGTTIRINKEDLDDFLKRNKTEMEKRVYTVKELSTVLVLD